MTTHVYIPRMWSESKKKLADNFCLFCFEGVPPFGNHFGACTHFRPQPNSSLSRLFPHQTWRIFAVFIIYIDTLIELVLSVLLSGTHQNNENNNLHSSLKWPFMVVRKLD